MEVFDVWVILQKHCDISRTVEWKNIVQLYDRQIQEDFSIYLFRWGLLLFMSNKTEKNLGLLAMSLHILSNRYFYERTGN